MSNRQANFENIEVTPKKSVIFLLTSKGQSEKEIDETFTVASKRIKILGISLTKEVKDLHTENYKILQK